MRKTGRSRPSGRSLVHHAAAIASCYCVSNLLVALKFEFLFSGLMHYDFVWLSFGTGFVLIVAAVVFGVVFIACVMVVVDCCCYSLLSMSIGFLRPHMREMQECRGTKTKNKQQQYKEQTTTTTTTTTTSKN